MSRWTLFALTLGLAVSLPGCDAQPEPPALTAMTPAESRTSIRVAGAAMATPLMARLVSTFSARWPGTAIVVDAPLSSEGAERAWRADALDMALVVTVGDDPVPKEAVLLAQTVPVLVVGTGVKSRTLTQAALAEALSGKAPTWPDGLARRVVLAPPDDPAQRALAGATGPLHDALQIAARDQRWQVVHRAVSRREALAQTPGAIGVLDEGALRLHGTPVWRVAIEAHHPESLQLWILPDRQGRERAERFVAFLTGPEGRGLARDLGYLVPEGPQ